MVLPTDEPADGSEPIALIDRHWRSAVSNECPPETPGRLLIANVSYHEPPSDAYVPSMGASTTRPGLKTTANPPNRRQRRCAQHESQSPRCPPATHGRLILIAYDLT